MCYYLFFPFYFLNNQHLAIWSARHLRECLHGTHPPSLPAAAAVGHLCFPQQLMAVCQRCCCCFFLNFNEPPPSSLFFNFSKVQKCQIDTHNAPNFFSISIIGARLDHFQFSDDFIYSNWLELFDFLFLFLDQKRKFQWRERVCP